MVMFSSEVDRKYSVKDSYSCLQSWFFTLLSDPGTGSRGNWSLLQENGSNRRKLTLGRNKTWCLYSGLSCCCCCCCFFWYKMDLVIPCWSKAGTTNHKYEPGIKQLQGQGADFSIFFFFFFCGTVWFVWDDHAIGTIIRFNNYLSNTNISSWGNACNSMAHNRQNWKEYYPHATAMKFIG